MKVLKTFKPAPDDRPLVQDMGEHITDPSERFLFNNRVHPKERVRLLAIHKSAPDIPVAKLLTMLEGRRDA